MIVIITMKAQVSWNWKENNNEKYINSHIIVKCFDQCVFIIFNLIHYKHVPIVVIPISFSSLRIWLRCICIYIRNANVATCKSGYAYLSGAPEIIFSFWCSSCWSVCGVLCWFGYTVVCPLIFFHCFVMGLSVCRRLMSLIIWVWSMHLCLITFLLTMIMW